MKQYELKAEECVFLDDREDNIEAARMLGMNGIVVESYEQAGTELNELIAKTKV